MNPSTLPFSLKRMVDQPPAQPDAFKWRLFHLLVLLTIVDGLQTLLVVNLVGAVAEANPLMRRLLVEFGDYGLIWFKAFAVFVVLVLFDRVRVRVMLGAVILMAIVVALNTLQIVGWV
ncbi:MAG: DUF5658 family protein [Planctomycetota bacterium]